MGFVQRTTATAAIAASGLALIACGGSGNTGANQSKGSGTYPVSVTTDWPKLQRIDREVELRIAVTNTGTRALPDVTVSLTTGVDGTSAPAFSNLDAQPGMADHSKVVWLLDVPPEGGDTALANSWSLGNLARGQTVTFIWRVRPMLAGPHAIRWVVAPAMLGGEAVLADGSQAAGMLATVISAKAPSATVNPKTGKVTKSFKGGTAESAADAGGGAAPDATTTQSSGSGGAGVP